ncbi:MAG TPA: rhomboid family intramembrane serine protease [Hanamia sp.]|nr:rhomboid family intramembrane serine protease [Hanamia sp.]
MKKKFQVILLPFFVMGTTTVVLYTFLDWLLFVRLHVFNVKEEAIEFWGPFLVGLVVTFLFLRPKLKILVKRKKGDFNTGFLMFAGLTIGASIMVAQMYMETATGKLTPLNNIQQIHSKPLTKFYTIKSHYIDKEHSGIYYTSSVSGRYNENLNLEIYIASPIYDSAETAVKVDPKFDSANSHTDKDSSRAEVPGKPKISPFSINGDSSVIIIVDGKQVSKEELFKISPDNVQSATVLKPVTSDPLLQNTHPKLIVKTKHYAGPPPMRFTAPLPVAWLCISYKNQISNHSSIEKKESRIHDFYDQSLHSFYKRNLEDFTYLQLTGNNNDHAHYEKAIKKAAIAELPSSVVLLEPKTNPFSDRNGNKFAWIFISFAIGTSVLFLLLLIPKVKEETEIETVSQEQSLLKGSKQFFQIFLPHPRFYVTPILIDINVLVFFLFVMSGAGFLTLDTNSLLKLGANFRPYTASGEWWRLLTSTFLHAGIIHLLMNMVALFLVGTILEPVMGKNRFAVCYIICGIMGSISSTWFYKATVSVGDSGAIFGLYGIFLVLMITKVFSKEINKAFLTGTILFLVYNLVLGFNAGFDNAAHIGGLISGFLIGLVVSPQLKEQDVYHNQETMKIG